MALLVTVFIVNGIIHCLGDFFLKRASIDFTWRDIFLAIGSYIITVPGWLWMLRLAKLATLASIGAAMNIMILVAMGVFVFHEHLTTREVIGIFLAIAAVAMFYK